MTEGLKNLKHAVLKQEVDPLEWCVLTLPIPCKIGLPCAPCEQSNEYMLFQSDENYSNLGMKVLDFKEHSQFLTRVCCMPSMRSFSMEGTDFYNNLPIQAEKPMKIPCLKNSRPELSIFYEGQFCGKIIEPCSFQLCNGKFHEIQIQNSKGNIIYNIIAKLKGNPCLWIPDKYSKKEITYKIYEEGDSFNEIGEIQHKYYGLYNELCSKADQYGITYPEEASCEEKALITMATIFIDYQWFENS